MCAVAHRPLSTLEVALAGNPNVGKSTLFNRLTGLHQHTGNWPGKTVSLAHGHRRYRERIFHLTDLPGTYSLFPHSPEEEIARDHVTRSHPDAIVVVLDATALERSLNLALQILECGRPTLLCVNLLDEAKRRGISVDLKGLSNALGVPVVGTVARRRRSLGSLLFALEALAEHPAPPPTPLSYPPILEESLERAVHILPAPVSRHAAVRALFWDSEPELQEERNRLLAHGFSEESACDLIVSSLLQRAKELASRYVTVTPTKSSARDQQIDRILTGRYTAYPAMLLFLATVFFLTLSVSGHLSEGLSLALGWLGDRFSEFLRYLHAPPWLYGALYDGIYCVLSTVVAVMLPPMAIFFPFFTLLEDLGYLPRVAYNLDRPFCRCNACGKQALTMCMGLGCNAAGVVGCRIIDSERERLLAILTNSLVPCNGRLPALLGLLSAFFVFGLEGTAANLLTAVLFSLLLFGAVLATLGVTYLLSRTVLRGSPSAFTLELPPYRRPEVGKILIRSLLDRTLRILGRAVLVAAPMGLLLWILADITVGGESLLTHAAGALDPIGRFLGMDGVLLLAFLLGLPANEIVLPIAVMIYRAEGRLTGGISLLAMKETFLANGWTGITALSVLFFFVFHWPCSTTLLTVGRETRSVGYTLLAAAIPTILGLCLCALVAALGRI